MTSSHLFILGALLLSSASSYAVLEMPRACQTQKRACAIKSEKGIFKTKNFVGGANIDLFQDSSLFKDASGFVFLLSGTLRAKSEREAQLRSVFADIRFRGEVYLRSEKERVLIRNSGGSAKITLRDGTELNLPQGFEVWIAGLDKDKKSQHEVLRKIDLRNHLALWSQVFDGNKTEFLAAVEEFKKDWREWQDQEAHLYREIASQAQAEVESRERHRELAAQRLEAQKRKNKELYRERSFSR